nr:hypothetical protein [Candidatus Sigynarchaeota archaeon]
MDFFEQQRTPGENGNGVNLERFCIVYLAYFDEARGHQLLLVHPSELKDDVEFLQQESKTVFIHSIWWMSVDLQAELSHVDLEFGGRNYLAKKFTAPSHRPKKRSGMDEDTPETIVLFLNIPISLNPFGGEILNKLYVALTSAFKDDFSLAIEKTICDAKIIKSPKDKETCLAGQSILDRMAATIQATLTGYAKQLEVSTSPDGGKQKALAYLLYQDIKKRPQPAPPANTFFEPATQPAIVDLGASLHAKVKLVDASFYKDQNNVNISLVNIANCDLDNCVVSIAYIEEFFERYFYDVNIDCWFEGEELSFQFECIGKKILDEYMITVKQAEKTIFQQKIHTNKLRVK